MIQFYQECNGDYLAVDTSTNEHHRRILGKDHFDGRAAAIAGLVGSVCTTGISHEYLRTCVQVAEADVPPAWRAAIGW